MVCGSGREVPVDSQRAMVAPTDVCEEGWGLVSGRGIWEIDFVKALGWSLRWSGVGRVLRSSRKWVEKGAFLSTGVLDSLYGDTDRNLRTKECDSF